MNKALRKRRLFRMKQKMNVVALIILVLSAIHAGLAGIFGLNVLLWLFDGQTVVASRIINIIVAIAGLWCINLIVSQSRQSPDAFIDGEEEEEEDLTITPEENEYETD